MARARPTKNRKSQESQKNGTKPVVDAVIDAVSALSDLARSIRARARHPVRETKTRLRRAGRTASRFGKRVSREAKEAVSGRGRALAETLEDLRQRTRAAGAAFRGETRAEGSAGEGASSPPRS